MATKVARRATLPTAPAAQLQPHGCPMPPAVHVWPGGQLPAQAGKMPPHGRSVDVLVELLVVLVVLVVVVGASDVELVVEVDAAGTEVLDVVVLQSAQQLPSVAVPPRASQRSTELMMRQRSDPFGAVHRHATCPAVPHAERAAHRTIALLHGPGRESVATSARAAYATHVT